MRSMSPSGVIVFISSFLWGCLGLIQPHWGEIECDATLTDRFPPRTLEISSNVLFTGYSRWYTFMPSYPTAIPRDVEISTCIEDRSDTMAARIYTQQISSNVNQVDLWSEDLTEWASDLSDVSITTLSCDTGETGVKYLFRNLPGDRNWEIPVNSNDNDGGYYKLRVRCLEGTKPASTRWKDMNITEPFPWYSEWAGNGYKNISCGASAWDRVVQSEGNRDWFRYTITDYAQEVAFTTCDPEYDVFNNPTPWPSTMVTLRNQNLRNYYWDYGTNGNRQWLFDSSSTASFSGCVTWRAGGDAYDTGANNILRLSPGTYYIGVDGNADGDYVLTMYCWDNAAVEPARAGTDYVAATREPTAAPITTTPNPTAVTAAPTLRPTSATSDAPTSDPTMVPTDEYNPRNYENPDRKNVYKGEISCGLYRHERLAKKTMDYYTFNVTSTVYWYQFDTCKDDMTLFDASLRLDRLDRYGDGSWDTVFTQTSGGRSCNNMGSEFGDTSFLIPGHYRIGIWGDNFEKNVDEDRGPYVLRMTCGEDDAQSVVAATTSMPTPAPVGLFEIPARDGRIVGDIGCGITIEGSTSAQSGDFHRFTVINGGIDWIKFDTCDETSFKNFLFVWELYNQTGHESYRYDGRDNSLGFAYNDDSTCNEIVLNDLPEGTYYVNIEGYNYFFDHGQYTISMECSDNSAVAAASNYTPYVNTLIWWAILLIVLACCCFCGCIIALIWYCRRRGGDGGFKSAPANNPGSPGEAEMGSSGRAGE